MFTFAKQITIWQWTIGFVVVNLAATAFLLGAAGFVQAALTMNHYAGVPARAPIDAANELIRTGLSLLHLPLMAAEDLLPFKAPPAAVVLWSVLGAEALLQSFFAAVALRWLLKPPRFFTVFPVPFVTRQTALLALALAASHIACSVGLYLTARFGARDYTTPAREAIGVLHPLLAQDIFQPYRLAEADNLSLFFLESLIWAFVTTAFIVVVRRKFFLRLEGATAPSACEPGPSGTGVAAHVQ